MKNSSVVFISSVLIFLNLGKGVASACPTGCQCSNVSAICSPGLTSMPQGFPSEFTALQLSGSYATKNQIPSIETSTFNSLQQLERLYMAFCNVESIASGSLPTTLRTLDLSFNKLGEIAENTFKGLTKLKVLSLSGNNGTEIQISAFKDLTSLRELYLAEMGLTKLDKRIISLPTLKTLDIHGNKLKRIDWSFTKISVNLAYIDISGNIFEELSNSSIMSLQHIKSIHLNDNEWHCTCALGWVKVLPSPIPESVACSSPDSLQYLSIVNVPSSQLTCVPASVTCASNSHSGKYHTSLIISCTFGGDPFPEVTWVRPDGTELKYYNYNHSNYVVSENGSLTIMSLDIVDDGQWTLQANNVKKQNQQSLTVTVTDIPTTTTTTTSTTTTTTPTTTSTTTTTTPTTTTSTTTTTTTPTTTTTTPTPSTTTTKATTKPTTKTPTTTTPKQTTSKKTTPNPSSEEVQTTPKPAEGLFSMNTIYMMIAAAGGSAFITSMICLVIHCCTRKKKPPMPESKQKQDLFDTVRNLTPRRARRVHNIASFENYD
ncbi:uncharacterized protein LOC111125415 [Crassostrea virginica]